MKPQIQYLLNIKLTKIHNSHHLQPSTSQHPSLKRETRNIFSTRKWKQLASKNDKEKDLTKWQFFRRISKGKKGTFTFEIWEDMKSRRRDQPDLVNLIWVTYPSLTTLSPPLHSGIAYPLCRSPEIMLASSTLNSMLKHCTILKLPPPPPPSMITLLWRAY